MFDRVRGKMAEVFVLVTENIKGKALTCVNWQGGQNDLRRTCSFVKVLTVWSDWIKGGNLDLKMMTIFFY